MRLISVAAKRTSYAFETRPMTAKIAIFEKHTSQIASQ